LESPQSAALVAAVFDDFLNNKCNFLHKDKLDIVRRVQFLTGRHPMRSFSPGAVAVIALWKSVPMSFFSGNYALRLFLNTSGMNKLEQTWSVETQSDFVRAGNVVCLEVVVAEMLREHTVDSQHH